MNARLPLLLVLTAALAAACGSHARAPLSDLTLAHEFDAPDRDDWQMPHAIVQALELQPGMSVVDLGAGTGYMLPFLSQAVGADGKVIAVEVQADFLSMLRVRAHHEQLPNITVLEDTATSLPLTEKVDRVLLLDTYRELEQPVAMLRAVRAALRPGGRVVIVDARPEPQIEGPPPEQRLSAQTVEAEARGAGLAVIADSDHLPRQYLLVLADESEAAKLPPPPAAPPPPSPHKEN